MKKSALAVGILVIVAMTLLAGCGADESGGSSSSSPAAVKRIFVTNGTYSADLKTEGGGTSGLDGADKICQLSAAAAGLGGTWVAWLSDDSTDAINRITGAGPWYYVDKSSKVFNNKTNLQTFPLIYIRSNENGADIGNGSVWTGTIVGGTRAAGSNCTNWTSTAYGSVVYGDSSSTDEQWTEMLSANACYSEKHLYCLEQ